MRLNRRFKEVVIKDKQIIAVLVFGSYARENGRKESYRDIDLCLVLDKRYTDSEMFDKKLRYIPLLPDKFDVNLFQQLPLYIRMRVLKEGKVILCKNEDLLYEIAYSTIKEFNTYGKIYYGYLESMKE